MKKKIFSLAIALSAFIGVNAQEWTLPIIGEDISKLNASTELYMYNVKADAFASAGMSWGTHAIVKELQNGDNKLSADVHKCTISRSNNLVQISLNGRQWLGGGGPVSTNDCWVDHGSNNQYSYSEVNTNTYKLKPTTATNDSYLDCSWAYGGHITFSATNGYGNTEWAFVKRENITNGKYLLYKAKKEMYDIYAAVVEAGHDDTYSDALSIANSTYTSASATAETVKAATKVLLSEVAPALTQGFYPVNSLFDSPDMRGAGDDDKWGNGLNAFGDGIFESWHSAETITQTKTGLPNGFYTVVFHGIYRQDGSDAAPTLKLTSGTNSAVANLKAITDIDFGVCSGGNAWTGANKPNDKYSAGEALTHTDAVVRVENFVVENGELTVTVSMPSGSQWLLCQGFEIFYKAESVEEYANLFKASKAAAEAIDKNALNEAAKNILNTALANAAAEEISKDWYNARIQELDYAVALAKAIAAQMPTANALVATCESYLENSTPKQASCKTAFETAIVQAKSEVNGATTAEALTKSINDLEAARQVYVVSAIPNGVTFDLNFKMTNNWINGGNTYNAGGVTMRERYFDDVYRTGDMMTQKISGLANGIYNVELYANANWTPNRGNIKTAAADAGAEVSSVFANEITAKVPLVHQTTTATAGQYKLEGIEVKDGTINLGIRNDANGANWILIAPKSLTFVSALDLSELIATLTNDLERANAINGKMSTAAQQQLAAAIEGADVNSDNPDELDRMISELQKAIAAAETSISDYAKIKTYIEKANKIDESIAASYQTQYDNGTLEEKAEDVFQTLEVATYNYVKDNFTYDVALSDTWNSTGINTKAWDAFGEHWDDTKSTTYKNQYDGWGDPKEGYPANSWLIDFDQEVTLPAGEYVFKVAGRKSVDATLELNVTKGETVLGTVNDFPSSNEALGINKAGVASFDAADPAGFAKDGKGYGWQWRYVKFTLAEKSTVKVAVHAETNKIYNWVSFGNYTLQMTEETYMAAGQPELDAALAAAQELVGTKPMGTAEETALNEAINLPVNTGADQKAKVNALNTAVENIKVWRAIYNAEKDKLVAALERFEADYNDADNGALNHMNKNRWATVIEKAQAAAVAKDNQTSHAVLTTATNELTEALDAATVSVNEYAALESAIDEANKLVAANVGDLPFERPQSAADAISTTDEQAVYDAATADGEGVTSVTDALNKGIAKFKTVPLNAPKAGARYNLVVNNNGNWEHDGKAVTYLENDRSDAGLYNIKYLIAPNANFAQAFTLTAVEGKQDCYYISMTDVEGNERYVCTGVVYGGNASQLRTTTKAEDALAVKVIATTIEGVHNLYNTAADNYIGGQDAGFFTVNSHINFNIREAAKAEVAMDISAAKWSTLILPFNAALPDGVKAYSCNEADVETETLTLTEATTLKANTPYLINGEAGTHEFSGYGLAKQDTYAAGIFTGTYVDYHTTANSGTYVLQKHDNVLAFYLVGESAQPWVRAYRCYITLDNASTARMFSFGFDNETTGIDNAQLSTGDSELIIFDIMGRKVTSMKKGNLYIINGKKVLVK